MPTTPLFDVPNLDGLADAEELETAGSVFTLLAEYARLSAMARRNRSVGHVAAARQNEAMANLAYFRLPEWAQW